jgi:hypothetical protein
MEYFEFIETPTFVRQREGLLDDDTFQALQAWLLKQHFDGDTIRHTGGCKKLRWCRPGGGKRGGVRVIYYTVTQQGRIYLLTLYAKNIKDNLTAAEKAVLKQLTDRLARIQPVKQAQNLRTMSWTNSFLTTLCRAWKRWWPSKMAPCSRPPFTAIPCPM